MQSKVLLNLLDEVVREKKVNSLFLNRYKNLLAPKFSIFSYFRTDELILSNILADLLDPQGSHGQDYLFIKKWIELRKNGLDESWQKINLDQSKISVKLEEKNWRLDTLRRMDILIEIFCHGEKYALCIENKPFASDQKNQLKDYADELEQRYPNQWQLIYLSGSGKEPSEYSISKEDSELLQSQSKLAVLGYADLIKWLTECILYTKNDRVKVFLEELKLYISQNFITQLSNEEQTVMLKNILDHDDYIKALIEVETLKLQVQENLLVKFKEDLNQLCEGFTLEGELTSKAYSGISIFKKDESKKIRFRVEFDRSRFGLFFLGIVLSDFTNVIVTVEEREKLLNLVQEQFPSIKLGQSPNWPIYIDIPELAHWDSNGDIWVNIKNGTLAQRIYNDYFIKLNEIISTSGI